MAISRQIQVDYSDIVRCRPMDLLRTISPVEMAARRAGLHSAYLSFDRVMCVRFGRKWRSFAVPERARQFTQNWFQIQWNRYRLRDVKPFNFRLESAGRTCTAELRKQARERIPRRFHGHLGS